MSVQGGRSSARPSQPLVLNDDEKRPVQHRMVVVRLLGYLVAHKGLVALTAAAMFVYSGTVVALPWTVRLAIDRHIADEQGEMSGLTLVVGLFLLVALLQLAAGYLHRRIMIFVGMQMLYLIRVQLFNHLQRLPMAFFDRNQTGRVMSRIQNDVEQLGELVLVFVLSLGSAVSIVGIAAAMIAMNVPLALISLVVAVAIIPTLKLWQRASEAPYQRVRQALAEVNSRIQENISGVRVVQSLNRPGNEHRGIR